jgi:H+/gluconate symporter-like permease
VSRTGRLAVSAALAAFALAAILLARGIPSRHVRGDPGPQAVPVAFAGIVLAGAMAGVVLEWRQVRPEESRDAPGQIALTVAAATVGFLMLVTGAGYVASTVLFLAGISWYLDRQRRHPPLAHALVAVTAALALWYVFGRLLEVVLPTGPWGF